MANFPELTRPTGTFMQKLLAARSSSPIGFEGAHVIGQSFWNGSLSWLYGLNPSTSTPIGPDKTFNGVLLAENGFDSSVLGVAGANGVSDLRTGMDWLYASNNTSIIDRIDFATTNAPLTHTNDNHSIGTRMAA